MLNDLNLELIKNKIMKQSTDNGVDFELEQISHKKTTLYNIKNDYLTLMTEIEENEGILTEEQNELLIINEAELQQKSIAYLEVIKSKEAFNGLIDEEIKRLTAIKKRNNSLVDILNSRLLEAVKVFGEFTIGTLTFGSRKSESVLIENEELIDYQYKNQKMTITVDKNAIKKAIKEGKTVLGASISENLNLKIK